MRRKIVNILTGASTVAFVVIAIVWGHSVGRRDYVQHGHGQRFMRVVASSGTMHVTAISAFANSKEWRELQGWRWDSGERSRRSHETIWDYTGIARFPFNANRLEDDKTTWGKAGFHLYKGWVFTLPLWPLCLATAILPAVRLIRWQRHRRRRQAGTCPTCGYDLRATPDRCPECGTTTTPTLHHPT